MQKICFLLQTILKLALQQLISSTKLKSNFANFPAMNSWKNTKRALALLISATNLKIIFSSNTKLRQIAFYWTCCLSFTLDLWDFYSSLLLPLPQKQKVLSSFRLQRKRPIVEGLHRSLFCRINSKSFTIKFMNSKSSKNSTKDWISLLRMGRNF